LNFAAWERNNEREISHPDIGFYNMCILVGKRYDPAGK